MTWQVSILTLFPEMFPGILSHSLLGKALADGLWAYDTVNIRDFATDKHRTVDDAPYGGGAGMVMRPDVAAAALDAVKQTHPNTRMLYLSPRGRVLTQPLVQELAAAPHITLLCCRYEGIDQRVLDAYAVEEVSIGDYILTGGELAAQVLIDACVRLRSGVLGNPSTPSEESFSYGAYDHLLEHPHYTRPVDWRGMNVPDVLTSGDHARIAQWRLAQAELLTRARRPDVWQAHVQQVAEMLEKKK